MTRTRQWRQVAPKAWWRAPFIVGYSLAIPVVAVLGASMGAIQFAWSTATVVAIAYFHYRARTIGIYTSDDGVRLRGLVKSRELGWADVAEFFHRPSRYVGFEPVHGSLWVVLEDGEELKTPVKMQPEGEPPGNTTAILAELNGEARQAHARIAAAAKPG
ncbi:hypothetical protein SAMN05421504_104641 [Amycolatopsis xylanica]|uniref:PH domain-containing protein n=1 Tax=Amycolatopsis xylanica TaxID=589385 RepID=A0A1H3HFK4_9PSEU|nr:hypothetical protein [Amycolatopsis xylanica]SDY14120.1 hypothetical protein SAMN05421504_104641 [Amycolatopsis xylanica]